MNRWIALIVFFLAVFTGILVMRLMVSPEGREAELVPLQTLEAGGEREVQILGRAMRNQAQAFYYLPVVEGRAQGEPRFFASLPVAYPELRFVVHAAGEASVVAVAAEPEPGAVLAVFDFEAGEGWPSQRHVDGPEAYQQRGRAMLERFKAVAPAGDYRFVRGESTRPLQELIDLGYEAPDFPEDAKRSPLYER